MTDPKALTITEHLPVKLDQYRKAALHTIENEQFIEVERLTIHLKNVSDSLKQLIKEAHKKQSDAAHAVHAGFEMAEVAIEQKVEDGKMVTYRMDTGAVVRERTLTVEELKRQNEKHKI
jgi:hypothetical protein